MLTVFEEMREFQGFSKRMSENPTPKEDSKNFIRKPGRPFKAFSFCCCESFLRFIKVCYDNS